ncbi:MAG: MDR family MFS transporter [Thermodesulfobacteriota bacterium]
MTSAENRQSNIPAIMISVMISLLLAALDGTIVGTAMPKIIGELHGMAQYSWPFTAYMLFSTLSIVVFGRLSDLYGRKPVYLFGILFFLFSSALCGLSRSMLQLIIFRGLQGIGGGVLFSSSFIIVGELFPPRERGKYMGLLASVYGFASVLGPAVGGLIADHLSWRWIFYVNIPLGGVACLLVFLFIPRWRPVAAGRKIDYWGVLFLILALLPFFLGLTWAGTRNEWLSGQTLGLLLLSLLMFLLFFRAERKSAEPFLPLGLFRNSIYAISIVAMFLSSAVMFCGVIYIPLFAQAVLGASATNSGVVTTPMMLGLSLSIIVSGRILSRTGRYKPLAMTSLGLSGVSLFLLIRMDLTTPMPFLMGYAALFGIGSGIIIPSLNIAVQNAFPQRQLAVATSSMQFFRNMGATVGTSFFGYVMNATMTGGLKTINVGQLPTQMSKVFDNPRILSSQETIFQVRTHLPDNLRPLFNSLLNRMRMIVAHSIHDVFLLGLIIIIVSFIVILGLKEIPLGHEKE